MFIEFGALRLVSRSSSGKMGKPVKIGFAPLFLRAFEIRWIAGRFVASVAGIAPKEYAAMEITMIQALSWKLTVSDEGMGALKNIMARPMQDLERWRKNGMVDSRGYPCRAVAVPQDPAEVTLENARKRARRS